jgi:hypothetical protein
MLKPLHNGARRKLLACSAMICAVPVLLAPLAARSEFELPAEKAAFNGHFSVPRLPVIVYSRPVSAARDPFIPDAPASGNRGDASLPFAAGGGIAGRRVVQGQPIGFEVPVVRAIVTGLSPRALVEEDRQVRVVGVGDPIDGSRIVAIGANGVLLKNGMVLAVTEERRP